MSEKTAGELTYLPAKKLRVFLVEEDSYQHEPLSLKILHLLRDEGLAGATVFKGTQGFGLRRVIHTTRVEVLSLSLPLTIEAIDVPEKIDAVIPRLAEMLGSGLIEVSRTMILRAAEDVKQQGEQ